MCDASNALLSIVGVLLALFHRQRTGEGQELWTSLLDGGVIFSSDVFLANGKPWDRPRLDRDLTGLSALYRLYRTQDDDWIMHRGGQGLRMAGLVRGAARRAPAR